MERIQFEVRLEANEQISLLSLVPGDDKSAEKVVHALARQVRFGEAWQSEYRSRALLANLHQAQTLQDIQAIEVPTLRKMKGVLIGEDLYLDQEQVSTNGEDWSSIPEPVLSEESLPVFELEGKPIGRYATIQWREGRIDIDPEPPAESLELFEEVISLFNGGGNYSNRWRAQHEEFHGEGNPPAAKRSSFEIREIAPLFSSSKEPFIRTHDREFWPLLPLEYSEDGKIWQAYPIGEQAPLSLQQADEPNPNDPLSMLSQMLDMQAVTVRVFENGQFEWSQEIPDHQAALEQSIRMQTGAGGAGWLQDWPEQKPKAIELRVMTGLLEAAPQLLDQSYGMVAYSHDGVEWLDLEGQE